MGNEQAHKSVRSVSTIITAGMVFFGSGIWTCNQPILRASTTTIVALSGQIAPDNNGILISMSSFGEAPVLDNFGSATFTATLNGTSGGATDNEGIFRGYGSSLLQLARKGQSAPGGGVISNFQTIATSGSAQTTFWANLTGVSSPQGVFVCEGGPVIKIVRTGDSVPNGDGIHSSFFRPDVNNFGQVAFTSVLTGTIGGDLNNIGVYRGDGGPLTQIGRGGADSPWRQRQSQFF